MWQYAAKAGIAMLAAGAQAKAQLQAEMAENSVRAMARSIESNRETEATLQNIANSNRQEMSDIMNIELSALRAEDEALIAKASTGLSGASMDDLDAQILIDVNKDKVNAQRQNEQNIESLSRGLQYSNENRKIEASQVKRRTNTTGLIKDALFNSVASSATSGAAGSFM